MSFLGIFFICTCISYGESTIMSISDKVNRCLLDPPECQGDALDHIPKIGESIWSLEASWNLTMRDQGVNLLAQPGAFMMANVSIRRISECRLRIGINGANFDEEVNQTYSGSITVVLNKRTIRQLCVLSSDATDNRLLHLASSITSSILKMPSQSSSVVEGDNFGTCKTIYTSKTIDDQSILIEKRKKLSDCGTAYSTLGGEKSGPFWVKVPMSNFDAKSGLKCFQKLVRGFPQKIDCKHTIGYEDSSHFASNIKLSLLSLQDNAKFVNEADLKEIYMDQALSTLKSMEIESPTFLMKSLCEELDSGLHEGAMTLLPQILSAIQRTSMGDIVTLYSEVKQGIICPNKGILLQILNGILRSATSPGATSAKCLLIKNGIAELSAEWTLSLGEVESPNDETLTQCSALLSLPNMNEGILGLSSLAGKLLESQCPSVGDCRFSLAYRTFSTALLSKAINCLNPRQQYQKMALWAIKGMRKLHPASPDLTPALKTCATSPSASKVASVEAIKSLGSIRCISGTSNWLREVVLNVSLDSEMRIEAFRSLQICDSDGANSLLKYISVNSFNLESSQVASYLDSFSGKAKRWESYLKLSQHLDLDLSGILDLPEGSKLEGDLIFEDSFLPRSIQLQFQSKILKAFGESLKFGIRQNNLEDVIQPLIGPAGAYKGIKDLLQSALMHIYEGVIELFQSESVKGRDDRRKRSLSIDDIKKVVDSVKTKVRETLQGWISAEIGDKEIFLPFEVTTLLTKLDQTFHEWLQDVAENIYSSILNSKIERGHSWTFQNSDSFAMTFFGPLLRLRQQYGMVLLVKGSSNINLLSLMKPPFNPAIDLEFNPNVGKFRLTSMDFHTSKEIYKSESTSPFAAGFDVSLRIRPQKWEHMEVKIDLPSSSTHGYTSTNSKKLMKCIPSNIFKDGPNQVDGLLVTHGDAFQCEEIFGSSNSTNQEVSTACDEELQHATGLKICHKEKSTNSPSMFSSSSQLIVKKDLDDIDYYKLTVSSKNPGQDSLFLSVVMETVGLTIEKNSTLIFGFVSSPHTTLKILFQGGAILSSFEASIVNDPNLKRLEARSTSGTDEYGLKAEILMVQDGGQVSVKPRLVLSRPWSKEDSLLEGYLAHYSSDKVKSFTLDIATDGTLRKMVDVNFKGSTEYRKKPTGEWSVSFKNLHMETPEIKLGLEATFKTNSDKKELQAQLTVDDDVMIFGGSLDGVQNNAGETLKMISAHFLTPARPEWDTTFNLACAFDDRQVRNNLTIENGPDADQWKFLLSHSTSWDFIYQTGVNVPSSFSSVWSALLHPKRTSRIDTNVKITIPKENFDWELGHSLESSEKSLENKVYLTHDGEQSTIMANFYDQSEQLFRYHMEIESNFPDWEFSYVDTILQRREGDIVGQSTTKMPSGRIYSSSSRVSYKNELDVLSLELSHDTLIKDGSESWRISVRHTLEHTMSNLNFLVSFDAPEPILNIEFNAERLDTRHHDYFLKYFLKNGIEGELSLGNTGSQVEFELNMDVKPLERHLKGKVSLEKKFQGGGSFQSDFRWIPTKDPHLSHITMEISSDLVLSTDGKSSLKTEIDLMGSKWGAELQTDLGKEVSDKKELILMITFPDDQKFEAEARLQIDIQNKDRRFLEIYISTRLPGYDTYKFSIGGEHKLRRGRYSDAHLQLNIDSPLTQEIIFNSSVINKYNLGVRTFSLDVNTYSEANFWKPINIGVDLLSDPSNVDLSFDGKMAEQRCSLDFLGSYRKEDNHTDLKIITEVKFPNEDSDLKQLKISLEGTLLKNKLNPAVKLKHSSSIERNFITVFSSSGGLNLQVPKVTGKLVIHHNETNSIRQEYDLEGKYTGSELEITIKGIVNYIPVRVQIHFIDGKSFLGFASYGGQNYASVEFKTKLKKFSLGLKKKEKGPARLTTAGIVIFKGKKTRFVHILKIDDKKTSANLRIQNVLGKPLRISTTRTMKSKSHHKSDAKLAWGNHKAIFKDNIQFRSMRDFYMEGYFAAPSFGVKKKKLHLSSSHRGLKDQTVGVSFSDNGVPIHSGTLQVDTSLLRSPGPWEIDVLLKNIIIGGNPYQDFKVSQLIHSTLASNLTVRTTVNSGQVKLSEFAIESSNSSRQISLTICSQENKCLKIKARAQIFSLLKPMSNFVIEFSSLNSFFINNHEDGLQLQVLELLTENKIPEGGELTVSSKLARFNCNDIDCQIRQALSVHHVTLEVFGQKIDLQYETLNRTAALSSQLINDDRQLSKGETKIFTQFWFDRSHMPDNVVAWNASYSHTIDIQGRYIEYFNSLISHPVMSKPLKLIGKLVSSSNKIKRDLSVDLEIFDDPSHDLRISAVQDSINGRHIFILKLQNLNQKKLYMSLTAQGVIPSSTHGQIDLRAVLTRNGDPSTNVDEIRLICDVDKNKLTKDFTCQLNCPTFEERASFRQESSDTCSGTKMLANIFEESYGLYGQRCFELPSMRYGISLNGKKEDFSLEAGLEDSKSLRLTFLDLFEGIATLHPPFLMQLSYEGGSSLLDTWGRLQDSISSEADFLVSKTTETIYKVYKDATVLISRLEVLRQPSSIQALIDLVRGNSKEISTELENDELAQDLIEIVKFSATVLNDGVTFLADRLQVDRWLLNILPMVSIEDIRNCFNLISREFSNAIWKDLNSVINLSNEIFYSALAYGQGIVAKVTEYRTIKQPIEWTKRKIMSLTQMNLPQFISEAFTFSVGKSLWMYSFIYPEILDNQQEKTFLVPLPESAYTILEVMRAISGAENRAEYKKTLMEEMEEIATLVANPERLLDEILPPYAAHAVLLPNSIVTLDGKVFSMERNCSHLVFATTSRNFKQISFTKGPINSTEERPELVITFGHELIQIDPDFEVTVNNLSAWIPLEVDGISVTRNVDHIQISLKSSHGIELFRLTCHINYNGCVLRLEGWLSSDVTGLLGNFDSDPSNEMLNPMGKVPKNEEIWRSSWVINTCRSRTIPKPRTNARTASICQKAILSYESPMLPCHSLVDIRPYNELCVMNLDRMLHIDSRHNETETHVMSGHISKYKKVSPYSIVPEASLEEVQILCDVMTSYTTVCQNSGLDMIIPNDCQERIDLELDEQIDNSVMVDILLLIEQTSCLEFLHENILSDLPQTMSQLIQRTNISALMGAIGYGSKPKSHLEFYGRGSSLLVPLDKFIVPDLPTEEKERSTLDEALENLKNYPFRKGSVRVVLVVSCSSQDLPIFDPVLLLSAKSKRILIYSLVPERLLIDPDKPNAVKNIIGMDSKYLYHLKKERITLTSNWKVNRPTSNIAQLALQSGGGVFSISSIEGTKKAANYMQSFREILSKTILFFSRKSHTSRAAY